MDKTIAIVAVAALATVAFIPSAQAVRAQSLLGMAAGADFGMGLGLYDPGSPPGAGPAVFCLALPQVYEGASVPDYYAALRYWVPATGVGPAEVDLYVPEPTNCAGLVPNDHIGLDSIQVDAGGVFWSSNVLVPTAVATFSGSSVWVKYCTRPTASPGPNGVVVVPGAVEAFGARTLNCGGFAGSHVLFPGCPSLGVFVVPGLFKLGPVFNYGGGGCNTLVGAPAGVDYAVQHCVSIDVFDLVLGSLGVREDQDHFVVAGNGALLGWATTLGAPASLFPNTSNMEPNRPGTC